MNNNLPFPLSPFLRTMSTIRAHRWGLVLLLSSLVVVAGCGQQASPEAYVARVGDAYLMQQEVDAALENLPSRLVSAEARRQFIDQWVTDELLFQEALRRNLRVQEAVQRRLAESERAVLIDALVSQLFEESSEALSPAEIRAYFELHKEQLRLHEPFVRVRYLYTANADSARRARTLLQQTPSADADSVWALIVARFAEDAALSQSLATNYFPESRLFMEQTLLRDRLAQLRPGQIAPLLEANGQRHLLQLADRVPAGTLPELHWVEEQVQRQLTIDTRKQMYERQVQRLRTEALSREVLVIE